MLVSKLFLVLEKMALMRNYWFLMTFKFQVCINNNMFFLFVVSSILLLLPYIFQMVLLGIARHRSYTGRMLVTMILKFWILQLVTAQCSLKLVKTVLHVQSFLTVNTGLTSEILSLFRWQKWIIRIALISNNCGSMCI